MVKKSKSTIENESEVARDQGSEQEELAAVSDNTVSEGNDATSDGTESVKKCDSGESPCTSEAASDQAIEELKASLASERERVLRLSAEFENYKKRSSREMADFRKFANESVFKQLLTVVDNLERAISSASANIDNQQQEGNGQKTTSDAQDSCIIQGVEMTYKDILRLLETFSVKPIEAHGKPFDPVFHQAVSHQESDQHTDNTVIVELQKGYLLHDRLLRPSMVVVAKSTKKE